MKLELPSCSNKYWLAFSGGLDSSVLLHVLLNMDLEADLAAIHIDHGLYSDSKAWAKHCREICQQWGVEFHQQTVDAQAINGQSPEAAARKARYQALQGFVNAGECLLTAHHQDDQAETLLLQLFRGAGVQGLASMPLKAVFGQGSHIRPLLNFSREQIRAYAECHQLEWLEDHSNVDTRFDRNYVRHELMPQIQARWPSMGKTIARAAALQAEAAGLLAEFAETDIEGRQLLKKVVDSNQLGSFKLEIKGLLAFSPPRRRNILRYWIRSQGFILPSLAVIEEILKICDAAADGEPCVQWGQHEIRYYRGHLYLTQQSEPASLAAISWDLNETVDLGMNGRHLSKSDLPQALASYLEGAQDIQIRFRQGGEQIRLPGRAHHHRLKQLLQERGVPSWLRDRLPLVFVEDQLIAVLGLDEPILSAEVSK